MEDDFSAEEFEKLAKQQIQMKKVWSMNTSLNMISISNISSIPMFPSFNRGQSTKVSTPICKREKLVQRTQIDNIEDEQETKMYQVGKDFWKQVFDLLYNDPKQLYNFAIVCHCTKNIVKNYLNKSLEMVHYITHKRLMDSWNFVVEHDLNLKIPPPKKPKNILFDDMTSAKSIFAKMIRPNDFKEEDTLLFEKSHNINNLIIWKKIYVLSGNPVPGEPVRYVFKKGDIALKKRYTQNKDKL